jgi:prevent-host-death family protein
VFGNVTTDDHNQVMNKVGIADLKARLSEHLRRVRRGQTLTVLDRETPVARIVPYDVEAPLE